MERRLEIKIGLVTHLTHKGRKEGPFYFVINTESDGFFKFKFTDKRGKTVDPMPLTYTELVEINGALGELVKSSDED